MGYFISNEVMDDIIADIKDEYVIYAPKLTKQRLKGEVISTIRYSKVNSVNDIVYDKKSDFSPKEIVYPVAQTLFFFDGAECVEKELDDERKMIVFMRACDIHGMKNLDKIFLGNGDAKDIYYARLREKVKFVLMECADSFDSCYCVSMGTNAATDYDAAVSFSKNADGLTMDIKDDELKNLFAGGKVVEFKPASVDKNKGQIVLPNIDDRALLKPIIESDYWRQYDENCIACGGCNMVCPSCSCFDTSDIIYSETDTSGERRRTWGSCMLESYTVMAGGASVRKQHGDNMRFKTLHKIYDFKERFGESHMCVGCGRCEKRCPKDIKFSEVVSGLASVVEEIKKEV